MSTDAGHDAPFVIPRPGVVQALGILNVTFALMILSALVVELVWLYGMARMGAVFGEPGAPPMASLAGTPMFGMNDPRFLRFCLADLVTGLVLNLVMLASGIALINVRRWGARLWAWTAWLKLLRLVVLWGFVYVLLVSPSLSENMARSLLSTMNPRQGVRGAPTLGQLTRVYAIMNLIMAAVAIVSGVIYPALSLWMLGRPGVKAALGEAPKKEPKLS